MSASLLWQEVFQRVQDMIDRALDRYRPDLTRATGIIPGQQLPTTGNTGTGYTPQPHETTHLPTGSDALPWAGSIHGSGILSARPAASTGNAGYLYLATDINGGTLYRSTGSTWEQVAQGVSETTAPSGSAGGDLNGTYPNPGVKSVQRPVNFPILTTDPGTLVDGDVWITRSTPATEGTPIGLALVLTYTTPPGGLMLKVRDGITTKTIASV